METTGMKMALALLVALFTLAALAACGDTVDEETEPTFRTTLSIRDTSGMEQTVFHRGEEIEFVLRVTNITNATATVVSGSSQIADFTVTSSTGGSPVWIWSYGKGFATVITNTVLAPLETVTITTIWDQSDIYNSLVPVGNYSAQGWMVHEQWADEDNGTKMKPQLVSYIESFTIK